MSPRSDPHQVLAYLLAGRAIGTDRTNEVRQAYGLQPLPSAGQAPRTLPGHHDALRAGLAIRRRAWEPGRYLTFGPQQPQQRPRRTSCDLPDPHGPGEWLQLHCRTGARSYYTPSQADALAQDWELMTETTF